MTMNLNRSRHLLSALISCVALAAPLVAQDRLVEPAATAPAANPSAAAGAPGIRRALIVCGLAGDADHRKLYAETVERLYTGLTTHHGFAAENLTLLWSDEATEKDGPALKASRGLATRETLTETVAALEKEIAPNDTLWVFVLGHTHYDGRYSWLNLPGTDINQIDFGKLFAPVRSREQTFFITTAASGFFLKPLAAPGRIVVTATEPELEVNETLFAHHLAKGLGEPPGFIDMDLDGDGRLSLLDLYLWTAKETAQEYLSAQLLATEHALLDDTGDGKGTELQANYLSEELGGRLRASSDKPLIRSGEGSLSRRVPLAYPASPPAPDVSLDE